MRKLTDVFELWDTLAEMADDVDQNVFTVQKWHQRKRIPVDAWPAVINAAKRKNAALTADDLLRAHDHQAA